MPETRLHALVHHFLVNTVSVTAAKAMGHIHTQDVTWHSHISKY
jgi:hypothetical protein